MEVLSVFVPKKNGQSLLEVLVAMAIAILILAALAMAVISAVRNAQFAKNQTLATKYANEGLEWLRAERDADWTSFTAKAGSSYCLNDLSWVGGSCSGFLLANIFKREATLITIEADSKVEVQLTVSWRDSLGSHQVTLDSYFTKREAWQ